MLPDVRHIWGMAFTLYDVMRVAAIAAALGICVLLNRRRGISSFKTLLIAAVCVPVSIGAARLLNAIEYGATRTNWHSDAIRIRLFLGRYIRRSGVGGS